MTNNNIEPTWKYLSELERLKSQLNNVESTLQLNFKNGLKDQENLLINLLEHTKRDVFNNIDRSKKDTSDIVLNFKNDAVAEITKFKETISIDINNFKDVITSNIDRSALESKILCDETLNKLQSLNNEMQGKVDDLIQQQNQEKIELNNCLNKINTLHFDIIDNEDNISISYVNPNGKLEFGAIKKILPDNETIILNKNEKLSLNYKFNPIDFKIDKNEIKITGLSLNSGKHLDADRINNDLNNATYNISSLSKKFDLALQKLNNINGYLASNNFKKANLDYDTLTNFAIECLSHSDNKVTVDLIPAGTKIKNTFDNHIWVFNRLSYDGLTTHKWEDFGADTICIASNDGVHGLVCGSNEHFKGFVDLNGIISINGLEEDFQDILNSLSELSVQIKDIQSNYESKILNLESRIEILERNA